MTQNQNITIIKSILDNIQYLSLVKYRISTKLGVYSVDIDSGQMSNAPFAKTKITSIYIKTKFSTTLDFVENLDFSRSLYENSYINFKLNDKMYKIRYSYAERIIREGYFINQANAELVRFLESRLNGEVYMPITKCEPTFDQFYFERYNKFDKSLCDSKGENRSITGIVDTIRNLAEPKPEDTCKYIMIANLRKEYDPKFRSGAIDTLELVKDLKST